LPGRRLLRSARRGRRHRVYRELRGWRHRLHVERRLRGRVHRRLSRSSGAGLLDLLL